MRQEYTGATPPGQQDGHVVREFRAEVWPPQLWRRRITVALSDFTRIAQPLDVQEALASPPAAPALQILFDGGTPDGLADGVRSVGGSGSVDS